MKYSFTLIISFLIILFFACKTDTKEIDAKKEYPNIKTYKEVKKKIPQNKTFDEVEKEKKSSIKIIINGSDISNIRGNASGFQINNLTGSEIDLEVNDVKIDSISSGGKGIIYNNGQNVESKSFIADKFPNLYNIRFWKQNPQGSKYFSIESSQNIFNESFSALVSKDQHGAAYLFTRDLEVSSNSGQLLKEKSDYIGLEPIIINQKMLMKLQPLERTSSNFGEPNHPNISFKADGIKNSCIYFILLKLSPKEIVFLTGRDKCIPWQKDFASWEAYVATEALNLSNFIVK